MGKLKAQCEMLHLSTTTLLRKIWRHYYALPFFCSFMAAILAFLSSRLLAISSSFSSLFIFARLGAAAAGGGVGALVGGSLTSSSHPSETGAVGMVGLEGG